MFSLNSANSMTNVIIVKGFEPVTFCVRDLDAVTVPTRHMPRNKVFKLSLIYASVIYQSP